MKFNWGFLLKNIHMAKLIQLPTIQDDKGKLTVFQNLLPDGIKRVFYIYDHQEEERGGHRHKNATHALICPVGSCKIYTNDGTNEQIFTLDSPQKCLILNPEDWRKMYDFSENAFLLCISNTNYDPNDYIVAI